MHSLFPITNLILHPGTLFLHPFFSLKDFLKKKTAIFFRSSESAESFEELQEMLCFRQGKRFPSFFQILRREKWNFFSEGSSGFLLEP